MHLLCWEKNKSNADVFLCKEYFRFIIVCACEPVMSNELGTNFI